MNEGAQRSSVLVSEDNELMGHFIDYTNDALVQLFALHADMDEAADPAGRMDDLHAVAHNIRGMGSSFGFPLMTETGTSLCNYLRGVDQGQAASGDIVRAHLETMRLILDMKLTGDGGKAGTELVNRLKEKMATAG